MYPKNPENFKNSKPRVQFYWFLQKNHTHVKKVGHTSEFLALIDELEKQLFIKKTVEMGE